MTLALALLMTSLPAEEVLAPFAPADITRKPVAGTALVEVLAQRGRGGKWLERGGRLAPVSPEGAAELAPASTQAEAERYVTLFEPGTVVDRAHAQRLAPKLPEAVKGTLVVERFLARTLAAGGAELVHVVFRFSKGARREETKLQVVEDHASSGAPAGPSKGPSPALQKFWDAINAP